MSYLVVYVLHDASRSEDVLDAWQDAGVKGITILESAGVGRVRKAGIRDDVPLMPSLSELFMSSERNNRTLFSVVEDLECAHKLVAAARDVMGDANRGVSGLLFIAPLVEVYGMGEAGRQ